jgi:hypothetical protein
MVSRYLRQNFGTPAIDMTLNLLLSWLMPALRSFKGHVRDRTASSRIRMAGDLTEVSLGQRENDNDQDSSKSREPRWFFQSVHFEYLDESGGNLLFSQKIESEKKFQVLMVLVFRFSMRVFRGLGTKC